MQGGAAGGLLHRSHGQPAETGSARVRRRRKTTPGGCLLRHRLQEKPQGGGCQGAPARQRRRHPPSSPRGTRSSRVRGSTGRPHRHSSAAATNRRRVPKGMPLASGHLKPGPVPRSRAVPCPQRAQSVNCQGQTQSDERTPDGPSKSSEAGLEAGLTPRPKAATSCWPTSLLVLCVAIDGSFAKEANSRAYRTRPARSGTGQNQRTAAGGHHTATGRDPARRRGGANGRGANTPAPLQRQL